MNLFILIRGGGDLASGVAMRLHRVGLRVIITELPQPLVVRRSVSFAEAVYEGKCQVEEVMAQLALNLNEALPIIQNSRIPVLVDPQASILTELRAQTLPENLLVLVDARMNKVKADTTLETAHLVIGLGPGFVAGENCHAVVETNRGHRLGRVAWEGTTESDTGIPDPVYRLDSERVLRSPADGIILPHARIGDHLEAGQIVAEIAGQPVFAPFSGVLRGLIHSGVRVWNGLKIGDVDPRDDPSYCRLISDKSLAIGGAVLEAILSRPALRPHLWD